MKTPLRLLLVAAFLNALAWIILIPVWQYPDEQAHFSQVQNIAENVKIPLARNDTSEEVTESEKILKTERDNLGNNSYTYNPNYKPAYSQNSLFGPFEKQLADQDKSTRTNLIKKESTHNPPLYYVLSAALYKFSTNTDLFERIFILRFFSIIFFLLTITMAYKIGRLIFQSEIHAISLSALVAFMPMFVFANTGVLPDPLVNLLFTIIVYFSTKILKEGFKFKHLFAVFVVFVFGMLTRQHFLIALPIASSAILYQMYKTKKLIKFFVSMAFVLMFFYFVEKFATIYPVISNFRIADISNIIYAQTSINSFTDHVVWTIKHTYSEVLPWYWGVYKWLSLTLPHIYYEIVNRILLIGAAGVIIYFYKIFKNRKFSKENLQVSFMTISILIYFTVFLIWDYFFRARNVYSFGIQGRYFFPIITPTFVLLLVGFDQIFQIFKKYAPLGFLFLVFLMIIANDFSLFYVASSYYDVSNLKTFMIQASQYKPTIVKGYPILLILAMAIFAQVFFIVNFFQKTQKNK